MSEYRPLIHFTAEKNWINDPNGMVYINGQYHLFYQHYPEKPHWGPMHWGHAVSDDLLHWKHLPIALFPDKLGYIFSGSCVFDKDNVSGLGTGECPPLIAFYTSHNPDTEQEQQSIAYSTDYIHFEKYEGNPVIPNIEKKDFRDPKVFWNEKRNCYSMVLAAGEKVEFYASCNLINWKKTGEFIPESPAVTGICECPDCLKFHTADGDKWVLILSMIASEGDMSSKKVRMGHVTQYFIGMFDGDAFVQTQKEDKELLLDYGTDCYAAVSFQNIKENIVLGWGDNWDYANEEPAPDGYRGKMTLARRLQLKKTPDGYRLCSSFAGLDSLPGAFQTLEKGNSRSSSDTFYIKGSVIGEGKLILGNKKGEKLAIEITEEEILIDCRKAGIRDFEVRYKSNNYALTRVPRIKEKAYNFEMVFDKSILEIIADDGFTPVTVNIYPKQPYDEIVLEGSISAERINV